MHVTSVSAVDFFSLRGKCPGADAGFWRGGVLHELLIKGRGAREARENFCGAHSNFSTDFIGQYGNQHQQMCATRLHSGFTDLNGCVGTCMRAFLCYSVEPLKIYHPTDSSR